MVMKKKLMCLMLSASMFVLSFTGCGGSESTVANSSEAEKNETVVENAGSEVTEIVEEEEPVMEAREGNTVAETEASDAAEKRYLVKSQTIYTPSPDGEKSFFVGFEFDYDELGHKIHLHYRHFTGQTGDEYYKYEIDDEGRILKRYTSDGNKQKKGRIEYSYTGDHYKSYEYNEDGWLLSSAEGFVKDGIIYETEESLYESRRHKTEADEEYYHKITSQYEGTKKVKSESFNENGEKTREYYYEYELDENNNPIVETETIKDIETGEESLSTITEYTYIEF